MPISDSGKLTLAPLRENHQQTDQKPQTSAPAPAQQRAAPRPQHESRQKPQRGEAAQIELAVLAAIYQNPKVCLPVFVERGRSGFIVNPVYRSFLNLAQAYFDEHHDLEPNAFLQSLIDTGQLHALGGPGFIAELITTNSPTEAFAYHLDILRDKYVAREIAAASTKLASEIPKAPSAELWTKLDEHEKVIADLRGLATNTTRLPAMCDLASMLNGQTPPRPNELIKGLLHQGSKLIVGGTSKGRKTFSLIDLAVSVATGLPWWGFETMQGRVCYINFEIQESFFCERATDICRVKKVELPTDTIMAWNLRGHGEGIENLVEEILVQLLRRQFVLVIVDPIYKALGDRDENKAGDVASMMNQLERIAVKTQAAIAFGAHYSKGNQAMKESVDRIGGSGVFARDPDSILTMTAHEEEDCFTVESTLRNFRPLAPFVLQWNWPLFTRDDDLDATRLKGANLGQFKQEFTTDMLMDHLSVAVGMKTPELRKIVDQKNGMSKSTFYNLKAEILRKKLAIERDGELFRTTKQEVSNG